MTLSEDEKRRLFERVDSIYDAVHGEGDEPGIKGRLDRLEQAEKSRKHLVYITAGAAVTAFFTFADRVLLKLATVLSSTPPPPSHP